MLTEYRIKTPRIGHSGIEAPNYKKFPQLTEKGVGIGGWQRTLENAEGRV